MTRPGRADGSSPPRWIGALLRRLLPGDAFGDLHEGFYRRSESYGLAAARRWYRREAWRYLIRLPVLSRIGRPSVWVPAFELVARDTRFALWTLARSPVFTGVVVVTLTVAIGATATVFSVLNVLLLRAIPVREPDRVIAIYSTSDRDAAGGGFLQGFLPLSYASFVDLRDQAETLDGAYAHGTWPVSIVAGDRPTRAWATFVSAAYFDVLGVLPIVGRTFRPEEDVAEGAAAVAVISYAFWQDRFAGAVDVIGRDLSINSRTYTVVGVAPRGFQGTSNTLRPDFWVPVSMFGDIPQFGAMWRDRGARFFFAGARLAPGRTLAEAEAELHAIAERLAEAHPTSNGRRGIQVLAAREATVNPNLRHIFTRTSAVLMSGVTLILLIACLNVGNLLLARGVGRRREMALRSCLGAGRARLVAQLLTETLLLFGLGGTGGLVLAFWSTRAVSRLEAPYLIGGGLSTDVDLRVLGFAAAVTLVCALVFGLAPAVRGTQSDLTSDLRTRNGIEARRASWFRSGLVAGQVALSLTLLVSAGLFLRGLGRAGDIDVGIDTGGLVTASVDLGAQGYDAQQGLEFYRDAKRRLLALPAVRAAAISQQRPLQPGPLRTVFRENDDPLEPEVGHMVRTIAVSPEYFDTATIPVLIGRGFRDSDRNDNLAVTVVNQRLADILWSDEEVLGQRLVVGRQVLTVVGVVPTGRYVDLVEDPQPALYVPIAQWYPPTATFFVRAHSGAESVLPAVRSTLQEIDPGLPLFDMEPADALISRALWTARAITVALGAFGLLGLTLAAVGIYGVVATSVRERSREMGLRMALGAGRRQVLAAVLARVARSLAAGAVAGLALTAYLARQLAPQLYGVSTTDALTYGVVTAALAVVAMAAAWVPARRATGIDPAITLRME